MASEATIQIQKNGHTLTLPMVAFQGLPSTLCKGCGHNSITSALIDACKAVGVNPYTTIKLSGIGCSSKTPAYFLNYSHGFNALHGRMPSVATGALVANRTLLGIGISGDGDTANIGIGQFKHACRRNLPLVYIIEDNGCYGLTKGQFSATADRGSVSKKGAANADSAIDLVGMALQLGATYIGRSFSGDKAQLVPLIKGAIRHGGAAFLDVISPCVAFNNHAGSTKSYDYVRGHNEAVSRIDFIALGDEITADPAPGDVLELPQDDGTVMRLRKLAGDHDPTDRTAAMHLVMAHQARGELVTGLLYIDPSPVDMHDALNTSERPLNALGKEDLCPGAAKLAKINASLR
jgi:2-oxoglutarate/2-oxoacid ferredoxin oxidoreductase subunit beta